MLMLLDFTRQLNIISIVGLPIAVGDLLLNCAAIIQKGQILGIVAKEYLPNYNEFYEKRWFASVQDLRTTELRFAKMSGPPRLPAITLRWQVPISSSIFQPATN